MKRKMAAGFLSAAMISSLLAGCGSSTSGGAAPAAQTGQDTSAAADAASAETTAGDTGASAAGQYQTTYGDKNFDNVTITVELFDRSNAPEGSTITDNRWTKYVNEEMNKVGINVEFIPVPRSDEVTKMQTMVGSQTAPDITITYTYAYAEDYFNQGGTWDLSPFIDGENQAKNLKSYIGKSCLDIGRNADGQLYGVVARRATTAKSNHFIRKDWLDELGLSVPTTTDELKDVLTKFVKNNPDGTADVVGAVLYQMWNMRVAFTTLGQDPDRWNVAASEDCIMDYYDQEGMKQFYQYMNGLYNDGLLHKEYYTLDDDSFKNLFCSGQLGFCEYNVNGSVDVLRGGLLQTLKQNNSKADVISIGPLKNVNDGKQYSAAYSEGGLIAFCPKTASEEKVEACVTYLDWLCSQDGGFVLYHGFEGEHYTMEDGIPVVKDAAYNAKDKDWIRTDLFLTGNQGYFMTVDDFNACTSRECPGYEQYVIDNYENALKGTQLPDSYYTSPSTSNLITDLKLVQDEYQVKLITCKPDEFDGTFEEYIGKLKDAGMDTIIGEREAFYGVK